MTSHGGLRFAEASTVGPDRRRALQDCWVAVSEAGGAVGFVPPVDADEVAGALDRALAAVADGRRHLGVLLDGQQVAGFGFVVPQHGPVVGHRATISSLQVRPEHQGRGAGRRLLEGLHGLARHRGTTQVSLTVRSGMGLERFYEALGYRELGRWPSTLRVAEDDLRDEIWMVRDL